MEITKFKIKKILREHLVSHEVDLSEEEKEFVAESLFAAFKDLGKDFINLGKVTRRIVTGAPRIPDLKRKQLNNLEMIRTVIKKSKIPTANIKRRYASWLVSNIQTIKDAKEYNDLEIDLSSINSARLYNDEELEWLQSQEKIREAVRNIKQTNDLIIDAISKEL